MYVYESLASTIGRLQNVAIPEERKAILEQLIRYIQEKFLREEVVNPNYYFKYNETEKPIVAYSKLYDAESNPCDQFAAVMTCSDAEANCPFIPGAEKRISLLYNDPKEFDGTPNEAKAYAERSDQIGAEMLYVFSKV